jgi:hypothetical protein
MSSDNELSIADSFGPDSMAVAPHFLWSLYLSERDFIKHHEVQRTQASNILAAIAAGLVVAIGSGEMTPEVGFVISIMLMAIGLFGYLFCGKLYSLIQLHAERSYQYLGALEEALPELRIKHHKAAAEQKHARKFKFFGPFKLNGIWLRFHVLVFIVGLACATVYGTELWPDLVESIRSLTEWF